MVPKEFQLISNDAGGRNWYYAALFTSLSPSTTKSIDINSILGASAALLLDQFRTWASAAKFHALGTSALAVLCNEMNV